MCLGPLKSMDFKEIHVFRMGFHNKFLMKTNGFPWNPLILKVPAQNDIPLRSEIGLRQIQVLGISGDRALQAGSNHFEHYL